MLCKKCNKSSSRTEKVDELYNYLANNLDTEIDSDFIMNKYNISSSSATVISQELRKREGIETRLEGKRLYLYYFKTKNNQDNLTEIALETKIPTKISFMK